MDTTRLRELREGGRVSVGNEHDAVVGWFPSFGSGIRVPYDSSVLEVRLEENVPALRLSKD